VASSPSCRPAVNRSTVPLIFTEDGAFPNELLLTEALVRLPRPSPVQVVRPVKITRICRL